MLRRGCCVSGGLVLTWLRHIICTEQVDTTDCNGCAKVEPGPSLGELLAMSNDKALSGKSVRLTTGPRKQQVQTDLTPPP